jgi:nucleoside-diphosphate-sugar epimerase
MSKKKYNKIFITGGAGYCGSRLIPELLKEEYKVVVYDTFYFGNFLPKKSKNLKIVKGDIRDSNKIYKNSKGCDVFLNLGCISNDASFELDERLSESINMDAFEPMVLAAKKSGIKRFIYASSSSVYGVSKKKNVTEDHPLVPLTLYNKYKGLCEPILFRHSSKSFETVIFRPATVCGYSPRQRLDLSVNILTNHAINNNIIRVFGGNQLRPNLHIKDYCRVVKLLLKAPSKKILNQIFNVGNENASILQLAKIVKNVVKKEFKLKNDIKIILEKSDDKRSYHINSNKIYKALGFKPKYTVKDAVIEICNAFKKNKFSDSLNNIQYYNVKKLKKLFSKKK